MKNIFLIFLLFGAITNLYGKELEEVGDDDLLQIIKSDEYAVVLFTKKDCNICDEYEKHLVNLVVDLKESLQANVVKAFNSQLTRLYSPTKEPALVFFRHGVPLLYNGPIDEDSIFRLFDENRTPIVKELSDENFEHLTQASSGATTGDWFLFFYNQECIECQRFNAVWESVGASLKNRMNVARINKDTVGKSTAKRFKVLKAPEYIFLRQGKFYRYEIPKYDINSFVSFAQEFYKNARAEKVPVPSTPFDDLVTWFAESLKQNQKHGIEFVKNNSYFILLASIGIFSAIFVLCICSRIFKKKATKQKKEKKAK